MKLVFEEPLVQRQEIGKALSGRIFRPFSYETVGACELGSTSEFTVAITFYPKIGDADFTEPVVVLVAEGDVERFISAIRLAQANIGSLRKDGAA